MAGSPKGIKNNSTRSVKFDWDTSEFEKNLKEYIEEVKANTKNILIRNAHKFAEAAAKYTPPSLGRNSIDKTKYFRPILVLARLINGGYRDYKPTVEDKAQFRKKMVYKVLNTKKGVKKGEAYAYCKTIGQAKKLSKIKTRGLARIMWGKGLDKIGATVPSSILRLIKKSPVTSSMDYSSQGIEINNGETSLIFENNAKFVEKFATSAKAAGFRKIMNSIMRELKTMADKEKEV